jgi:O-succinylbenzoic acid--CoA ligase
VRDPLALRARATPDRTVLVDAPSDERWTAADLDAEVGSLAARLAGDGVGAGERVALLAETSPDFVRTVFAAWRVGAVLVPLNARLEPPELRAQLAAAGADRLLCTAETAPDARAAVEGRENGASPADGGPPVRSLDATAGSSTPLRSVAPTAFDAHEWDFEAVAALVFTSGTTGEPKAVRLTAGNFLASAAASAPRLGVLPEDRWLCPLSMYHMGGLSVVLRSVYYGSAAVIERTPGFDPRASVENLAAYGCTGVSLVPTMLSRMLDAGDFPDSLRFVLTGGAPAGAELIARCERRGVPVCPTYGMTEAASQVATARPGTAFAHEGTVGQPLLGTEVTIVGEDGEALPADEPGEIVVRGPTVTPGYEDAEATAKAFGAHGFHTGDVGYWDEAGRLWVLNRRSDRIVTGGENVHPGEVAGVLREHPDIAAVAVLGLDDPEWGERVGALVVPAGNLSPESVYAFCEGRLAGFKRPRTVAFVDALPRTASGTVDRGAARELLRERGTEV